MRSGDRVTVSTDGLGVFSRECWTPETGRKTNRIYFDPDVWVLAGEILELIARDEQAEGDGWWFARYKADTGAEYLVLVHLSMVEADDE